MKKDCNTGKIRKQKRERERERKKIKQEKQLKVTT